MVEQRDGSDAGASAARSRTGGSAPSGRSAATYRDASGAEAFAESLRAAGIVKEPLLRWALEEHRLTDRPVHELLAERAPAEEEAIYRLVAEFLGVDFEPLKAREPDEELTRYLPSQFAMNHQVAPVARDGEDLLVATSRLQMLARSDQVSTVTGLSARVALSAPTRLNRYLQGLYGLGADTVSELVDGADNGALPIQLLSRSAVAIGDDLDSTQEASVTNFVNRLVIEAVRSGASDLHIEPYEQQLRVRFRIDGVLQEIPVPPAVKQLEQAIISRLKVLGDLDIAEKRLSQDGQIRLSLLGRAVDVRVSVLPSIHGESVVLRLLDRQSQFRDLGEIGMPEDMLVDYRDVLNLAQGLVLVTGPTGSGKTTTLYASLNYVNLPGRKIITVEDPVEYRLEGITQIQVKESIGLGFSSMLRSIVRHDPDVIMIGEIRDSETANIAMNSAITGHLVLATLHTNDAPTAVTRLANMNTPRYMIASALKVVVAQRLVRLICPHCRYELPEIPPEVREELPALADGSLWAGRGCEACRHTGYSGRTGVFESLVVSDSLAEMVAGGATSVAMRNAAVAEGLVPLRRAGLEMVRSGVTTLDEFYRVTRDVGDRRRNGSRPHGGAGADGAGAGI